MLDGSLNNAIASVTIISGSVGRGGRNGASDVRAVQLLLNDWRFPRRLPQLRVDGIVGPITISAIEGFQQVEMREVDGRCDAMGPTIRRMAQLHFERLSGLVANRETPARYAEASLPQNWQPSSSALREQIQVYFALLRGDNTPAPTAVESLRSA